MLCNSLPNRGFTLSNAGFVLEIPPPKYKQVKRKRESAFQKAVESDKQNAAATQTDIKLVQCESCLDTHAQEYALSCGHSFCRDCIRGLFVAALNDHTLLPVKCCGTRLDQRLRRDVLDLKECFDFEAALEQVEAPHKMYCPTRDCGAFYNLDKVKADKNAAFTCSICRVKLCKLCHVSHQPLTCAEYEALPLHERDPEDLALFDTAKRSAYARCNGCSSFVEKIDGCSHVLCRCGNGFCYTAQRYVGPTAQAPNATSSSPMTDFDRVLAARTEKAEQSSAYVLEEVHCAHTWRGCNRVLDKPRLCHLCQRNKRCFQSVCTKCRLRVCSVCKG